MGSFTSLVPFLSIFVFIIEIVIDTNNVSYPITYIPLVFGLLNYLLIKPRMLIGPGIKVAYFVMIVRYLLAPFLLLNSHYFSSFEMNSLTMFRSVALIIIEMIVILLTIAFNKNNNNKMELSLEDRRYSFFVPLLLLFISLLLSIKDPVPLSRYHFILSGATEMYYTDLENSARGLPRLLSFTHKLLISSLIIVFYNWNKRKGGNNKRIFWFGVILVTLLTSFYEDVSRNSMLIPLLTIMFLFGKIYPKMQRRVVSVLLIVIVLSMASLTLLKQFHTTSFDASLVTKEKNSMLIERYFGGTVGVYECMQQEQQIKSKINSTTLLTEAFGNMFFVGRFLDNTNRTSVFYNESVRSLSFIIPTISEGFFHFGWLFCWLLSFAIIKMILYFDKLFLTSTRIDYSFIFAYISVSMGWMHPGNFIICMSSLHIGLALLLFFVLNDFISKHIVFRK